MTAGASCGPASRGSDRAAPRRGRPARRPGPRPPVARPTGRAARRARPRRIGSGRRSARPRGHRGRGRPHRTRRSRAPGQVRGRDGSAAPRDDRPADRLGRRPPWCPRSARRPILQARSNCHRPRLPGAPRPPDTDRPAQRTDSTTWAVASRARGGPPAVTGPSQSVAWRRGSRYVRAVACCDVAPSGSWSR